jgi:hypothetical protein
MAPSKKKAAPAQSPQAKLIELAGAVESLAKTARRNKQSLSGSNFYADRLADLRADATNTFKQLSSASVGDASTLAELLETCFSPTSTPAQRRDALRDLRFQLKTAWSDAKATPMAGIEDAVFPLSELAKTKRTYLVAVARQMNGCYVLEWYDACAVMMRRLLETCIIEAFEAKGIAAKAKNPNGDFLQLTDLISAALAETTTWNLTRQTKAALPKLRDIGHTSAHNRYHTAFKKDIDDVRRDCRNVIQEFLTLAGLL